MAVSTAGGQVQPSVTSPEPSGTTYSSSYTSDFGYANSRSDTLSPSCSTTINTESLPPPPPLESFGYPEEYYPEGEPEETFSRRRHRNSENVDLDSSGQYEQLTQRPQIREGSETSDQQQQQQQTEFKHFASMAAVFQSSSGGPANPPDLSIDPLRIQTTPSNYNTIVPSDTDHRYSDQYDRAQHSSSSSNSLAFSPPEFYRGHPDSHHAVDNQQAIDFRPSSIAPMVPLNSTFQMVRSLLFCYYSNTIPFTDLVQQVSNRTSTQNSNQQEMSRAVIQENRSYLAADEETRPMGQQQQRRSVLVSTRSAAAAVAAAAAEAAMAAALENQTGAEIRVDE